MEKYVFEEKNTPQSNPRKVCSYIKFLNFHEYTKFLVYRVLLFLPALIAIDSRESKGRGTLPHVTN